MPVKRGERPGFMRSDVLQGVLSPVPHASSVRSARSLPSMVARLATRGLLISQANTRAQKRAKPSMRMNGFRAIRSDLSDWNLSRNFLAFSVNENVGYQRTTSDYSKSLDGTA